MTRATSALFLAAVLLARAGLVRAEHLQPGDLAPFTRDLTTDPPTLTPTGDGVVNIADVVVLLRASVGIHVIVNGAGDPVASLQARLDAAEARLQELESLFQGVSRDGDEILVEGANVRLVNGLGRSDSANGLGNLIVGYSEARGFLEDRRGGSHNIVLGIRNNFSGWGGIVAGENNAVAGPFASVLGGSSNSATGLHAVVTGGEANVAQAAHAAVAGGFGNLASAAHATVGGGRGNEASAPGSSVAGGAANSATGDDGCVLGGIGNEARGEGSSVAGGLGRIAAGEADAALGSLTQDN